MTNALNIGVVDFSEPTLLLVGRADAFDWFAKQIASHRELIVGQVSGKTPISLRFVPVMSGGQLIRIGGTFHWEISASAAQQLAHQLEALAASDSAAHVYLDPASNTTDVQIIASMGEYDPERVFGDQASRARIELA